MPAGRYEATSPSLFDNPGGPLAPRYTVDVPGAINALANGTSSVIHGIYARKMAQRQQEIETQRYNQQSAWHQDEVARQATRDANETADRAARLHLDQLKAGVTPPSTSMGATSGDENPVALAPMTQSAATGTPAGASPIAAAMGAPAPSSATTPFDPTGRTASPMPALAQTPSAAPTAPVTFQAPQPSPVTTTTPERYDPTKSEAYMQHQATAELMAGSRRYAADQNLEGRRYTADQNLEARKAATDAYRARTARMGADGGSGIKRAFTAGQRERMSETVDAPALLSRTGWDLDAAKDILYNTPEGKNLVGTGFSVRHLEAAYEKHITDQTKAAMRAQSGPLGSTPSESVDAVRTTDGLVRKGRSAAPPAAGAAPAPASGTAPASTAPAAAAPAKRLTAPAAAEPEPTDDELRQALASGIKPTDAKGARAWVAKHRKSTVAK